MSRRALNEGLDEGGEASSMNDRSDTHCCRDPDCKGWLHRANALKVIDGISEEFIQAVKSRSSKRHLTLDMYDPNKRVTIRREDVGVPYVADSHVHYMPFGGDAVDFKDLTDWQREAGVLFTTVFGIGQRLPIDSPCQYYLDTGELDEIGCGKGEAVRPPGGFSIK